MRLVNFITKVLFYYIMTKTDIILNYLLSFRVCLIMFRHAFFFLKYIKLHKVKKKELNYIKFNKLHNLLHKV